MGMRNFILFIAIFGLNGCASMSFEELMRDPNYVESAPDHQPKWSSPEAQVAFLGALGAYNQQVQAQNDAQIQYAQEQMERRQIDDAIRAARTQAQVTDALSPITNVGSVTVGGYTRRDGTYVSPHTRTAPDSSTYNNMSQ